MNNNDIIYQEDPIFEIKKLIIVALTIILNYQTVKGN